MENLFASLFRRRFRCQFLYFVLELEPVRFTNWITPSSPKLLKRTVETTFLEYVTNTHYIGNNSSHFLEKGARTCPGILL